MRMGQGVRTGLGHGGITCVLQTQFSSLMIIFGGVIFAINYFPRSLESRDHSNKGEYLL